MNFKLIDITEIKGPIDFPEPRDLTPEEEAQIIAHCKAEIDADPDRFEAEIRQLLEQHERGELIDAEILLREIESGRPPRKPS